MSPISPQAKRRRKILTRAVPVALIGVISFVAGALVAGGSPSEDAAQRFVDAWARQDFPAMHAELSDGAAARYPLNRFTRIYNEAQATASVDSVEPGDPAGAESVSGQRTIPVPVVVHTHAFGDITGPLQLPVSGEAIAWEPHLVLPGLGSDEELARRTDVPDRAPILARDGTPLAEGSADSRSSPIGPAATNVTGELGVTEPAQQTGLERLGFPEGSLAGTSGIEQAFNGRLAGQPGGELLAVSGNEQRVLANQAPEQGRPVRTTIDPELQQAAVSALGDLFGGVAVLNAEDGSVRALAGIAFSGPQPPGSTFKVVTTVAALDADVVNLDDTFPIETSTVVGGREIANAHDEPCGGTFAQSFARSCNTVFAPLGPEIGNQDLVDAAERFGFNSPPMLFNAEATAAVEPPASTIPKSIGTELDLGVTAIGQGQVLATPLQLASISQTIAAGGRRSPTPLVTNAELGPDAEPIRVTSGRTAGTVRDLMVGVVEEGTGIAAAIPGVEVAGKTGTAELGPEPATPEDGQQPPAEEEQEQDAWFTAFAPADDPNLAVAVMIVNAEGDGGEIAAPIAQEVLAAGVG